MLTSSLLTNNIAAKVAAWKAAAQIGAATGANAAAMLFENEAKTMVHVESGELKEKIHIVAVQPDGPQPLFVVTPTDDAGNKYGFEPPYARRLEFGFIGVDSLGRHYHQPPYPYMRPAYDSQQQPAGAAVKQGISTSLQGVQ